jgi:hypothetical protein
MSSLRSWSKTAPTPASLACDIEHDNLKKNQDKMKHWYDKYAMVRELKPGEKVIVLLLIPCHPLPGDPP